MKTVFGAKSTHDRATRNPFVRTGLIAVFAAVALLVGVGGFTTVVEATNSVEFCTSCHTMSTNYEEYKQSVHYSNRSGVRAGCSDCHVPKKNWYAEMYRKLEAAKDV